MNDTRRRRWLTFRARFLRVWGSEHQGAHYWLRSAAVLLIGWALLYVVTWGGESLNMQDAAHVVRRWDDSRCAFALLGSIIAWLFIENTRVVRG